MDFLESGVFKNAYLGKHALALMMQTSIQMESVYQRRGLIIPLQVSSALQYLAGNEGCSTADIAKALNVPHQLASQRIVKLISLELVERRRASDDTRRFELYLTPAGQKQAGLLMACMRDTAIIYEDLFEEIGTDLVAAILKAMESLDSWPLSNRFAEKFEKTISEEGRL